MNLQCPYCGRADGTHLWAGTGGCPGAASERVRDGIAAAAILGKDLVISGLQHRLSTMQHLCQRAADALEDSTNTAYRYSALIAELRKAAK